MCAVHCRKVKWNFEKKKNKIQTKTGTSKWMQCKQWMLSINGMKNTWFDSD